MIRQSRLYRTLPFLAALTLLAGSVQAQGVKDTVKETFKVRPGGTLFLDIDRGNIEIVSRSGDAVVVEMERIVDLDSRTDAKRVLENHGTEFSQRGNDIHVRSRFERERGGLWGRWRDHDRFKLHVTVYVPERYNVNFTSGAGNVRIADIGGSVEGRTGAGNVDVGAVRGPVDVSSGSGNVSVEGAVGHVAISTGAGNVKLRDVQGEVEVNTGAGNIEAEITRQPQGASRLESGAGNVTVYLADRIGVKVEATASVGAASTDFPLTVEGKWMKRSFEGPVNGGGPTLSLRAGVGNVALLKR